MPVPREVSVKSSLVVNCLSEGNGCHELLKSFRTEEGAAWLLLMIFFNQDCAHCSHQRFFIGEDSKHAETTLLPVLQKVSASTGGRTFTMTACPAESSEPTLGFWKWDFPALPAAIRPLWQRGFQNHVSHWGRSVIHQKSLMDISLKWRIFKYMLLS